MIINSCEYVTLHWWLRRYFGRPTECSKCHTKTAKKFEWANISGEYKKDISDYIGLCVSCHHIMDRKGLCKKGHKLTGDNVYQSPTAGRICRKCRKETSRKYYINVIKGVK